MANYKVKTVSLDVARERESVSPSNVSVESVSVLTMPADAVCLLHVGEGKDGIPLAAGMVIDNICPPEQEGLFVTVPVAQPGVAVQLLIGQLTARMGGG